MSEGGGGGVSGQAGMCGGGWEGRDVLGLLLFGVAKMRMREREKFKRTGNVCCVFFVGGRGSRFSATLFPCLSCLMCFSR